MSTASAPSIPSAPSTPSTPLSSFAGRVVLVTGGSDGIGAATVELFARRGARVFVADVQRPKAAAEALGVTWLECDAGVEEQVEAAAAAVEAAGLPQHKTP